MSSRKLSEMTAEERAKVYGWVNGTPAYSRDEFVFKCRRFGAIESDEELIEFARKVTGNWHNAGWNRTFTTYYMGDYCLDEPMRSLTTKEYERLKELQRQEQAKEKAADDAREWKKVDTIYWADNSVEEIWRDKNGEKKRVQKESKENEYSSTTWRRLLLNRKERRKKIAEALELISQAKDILEEVKDEEQECYDNLPEGLQNAERGEQMQENVDNLEEFIGYLEEVDALEEM